MHPSAPEINGPISGKPRTDYNYTFSAIDPDGDDLYYYVDWGDGTDEDWVGPCPQGQDLTLSHSWIAKGEYCISARVKDVHSLLSPWGTLKVTMPKNKIITNALLMGLFERFPNAFPIIRYLLGFQ